MEQRMTQPDPGPERMLYCNCAKCEGQHDEYYNDILDPEGDCISRHCADIVFLEDYYYSGLTPAGCKTNADYDLLRLGPEEFLKQNQIPYTFEVLSDCLRPE